MPLAWFALTSAESSYAQEICAPAVVQPTVVQRPTHAVVEKTVYDQTPVKVQVQVEETVYEKQQVTTQRPIYTTETRQRRTTSLKPVVRTSERVETGIVQRPVETTVMVDRVVDETVYDKVTEMVDQNFIVDTPVTETQMRQEKVLVQKPVTRQQMQIENVTLYRPTTVRETQLRPANVEVQQLVPTDCGGCTRRQWLDAGYYIDPQTGQSVYRRRGYHRVREGQQYTVQRTTVPTLTAQQVDRVTMVPETHRVQKPVNVTTMENVYENRNVPVQVQTTQRRMETRRVPVERSVPRTVRVTKRVPVPATKMVDEVVTRRVPYTETVYETVEKVEEYEQPVVSWQNVTAEVTVPKRVSRTVEVEVIKHTPRTVTMRVPLDAYGNPMPVTDPTAAGSGTTRRYGDAVVAASEIANRAVATRSNFQNAIPAEGNWQTVQQGRTANSGTSPGQPMATLNVEPQARLRETSGRDSSQDGHSGTVSVLDTTPAQTAPAQPAQTPTQPAQDPTQLDPAQTEPAPTPGPATELIPNRVEETSSAQPQDGQPEFNDIRGSVMAAPATIDVPETETAFVSEPAENMTLYRPEIPEREAVTPAVESSNGEAIPSESATRETAGRSPARQEFIPDEPVADPADSDLSDDAEFSKLLERFPGATVVDPSGK